MASLGRNIPIFEDHERFLSKIFISGEGCWIYSRGLSSAGYGSFSIKNVSYSAHRVSFELFKDKIAPTNVIDHICRNRKCVNPEHLRQVSYKVNARENNSSPATINAAKTHCKNGHELCGANLYARNGRRHCRACREATWKSKLTGVGKGYHNRIKTHCKYGHEYSADNIYIKKSMKSGRICRVCYTNWNKIKKEVLGA
jgi:hypothetical protein